MGLLTVLTENISTSDYKLDSQKKNTKDYKLVTQVKQRLKFGNFPLCDLHSSIWLPAKC